MRLSKISSLIMMESVIDGMDMTLAAIPKLSMVLPFSY